MAKLPTAFNADDHDEMQDFSPLPTGKYLAQIVESSMELTNKAKEARDDTIGQYLKVRFEVLVGPSKGRNLFTNLNLINPSDKAVQIANDELATICRACGKAGIGDSSELHDIPMIVNVFRTRETPNNPPRNNLTNYWKHDDARHLAEVDTGGKPVSGGAAPAATKPDDDKPQGGKLWDAE